VRLGIIIFAVVWLTTPASAQISSKLDYRGIIELQAFNNTSSQSWYSGGFAKLRYDADSFPIQLGKAGLHLDYRLIDTLWIRTLSAAHTDPDFDVGVIEAYLQYRPVPRGPLRLRAKAGAFHLPVSLENKGIAWSSLYSTTPSVINAWTGEELRVIGAELDLTWPGRPRQSPHDFSLTGGIFGFNDGAGTIIAYRGWAQHDRQTHLDSRLRLIPEFPGQIRQFDPFREIDDRPGYYVAGSWAYMQRITLSALHYDNRAEPTAIRNRQIAWRTRFDQISAEIDFANDIKLIGQYMLGDSLIDNRVTGLRSDVDYSAWFILLTRLINKHRVSLRYEKFEVNDLDLFKGTIHNSDETGDSWMLAYRYRFSDQIQLGAEWLQIRSKRGSRLIIEGIGSETEKQLLFNISYRF